MLYSLTTNNSICHQNIENYKKTNVKPAKPSITIINVWPLSTGKVET